MSVAGKQLERIIFDRIYFHLGGNRLIRNGQYSAVGLTNLINLFKYVA